MIRMAATVIVFGFALYISAALAGAFLPGSTPGIVVFLVAVAAAFWMARYTWTRLGEVSGGPWRAVTVGAWVVGGIGFCGGFFGPLIFAPQANQGPLLGIFITGPLGFLAGGIGGYAYWWLRRRDGA
jgi:hypothetical protein